VGGGCGGGGDKERALTRLETHLWNELILGNLPQKASITKGESD